VTHKITRLVLFAASAAVLSMYTAGAVTCDSLDGDSLQYFITSVPSCTYGGLTFSNFSYENNNATGSGQLVTAANISVSAVTNSFGAGLSFDASFNSGFNGTSDGSIDFSVSAGSGPTSIEDAGLEQVSGATGTGIASVVEQGCGSSPSCTPGTWGTNTFEAGPGSGLNASTCALNGGTFNSSNGICDLGSNDVLFTPTGSVNVVKDVNVTSGGAFTGSASISLVSDTFSVVPEPRALSLVFGFALLAGLVLRKKFQSASV
jgi:hypothetical protein